MPRALNPSWLANVEENLGRGVPHDVIITELRDLGLSAKKARRYIAQIVAQWGERVTTATTDEQRAELVGLAMSVYREARAKGHHKTALAAIDTTARLLGLVGPQAQVAVFNAIDTTGALTSGEAVKARLAELKQKDRQLTDGGNDGAA